MTPTRICGMEKLVSAVWVLVNGLDANLFGNILFVRIFTDIIDYVSAYNVALADVYR